MIVSTGVVQVFLKAPSQTFKLTTTNKTTGETEILGVCKNIFTFI